MVRLVVFLILIVVSAKADLVFWSPAGQNLTYILPEGINPEIYLKNVKAYPALAAFVEGMELSEKDIIQTVKPQTLYAESRALLIANKIEDHSKNHPRVNNFGKYFEKTLVFPIGAALKLSQAEENKFYSELGIHFGLFIFMGGDDKHPALYGEKTTWSVNTNRLRDDLESKLARFVYFKTTRKIFGVCRGLQLVFTSLGGKLNQDLNHDLKIEVVHKGGTFHPLVFAKTENQTLKKILESLPQEYVNSYHHQSALESSVPGTVFEVSARSPEGVIEGLESRDGRILLIQSHPELRDNKADFIFGFFRKIKSWARAGNRNQCGKFF